MAFTRAEAVAGTTIPVIWAELYFDDGTELWAKVELIDPSSYYGGRKEARLLQTGRSVRALSDYNGEIESSLFSIVVSDSDKLLRTKLGYTSTKNFVNRTLIIRMVKDSDRRSLVAPEVLAIGIVKDYAPLPQLKFGFTCEDYITLFTGFGQKEALLPKRRLTRTDFADLPSMLLDKPVPIVYGEMIDAASVSSPPVLSGTASRGAFFVKSPPLPDYPTNLWVMGWGDIAGSPGQVTGVSATANSGGEIDVDDIPGNILYVSVTAISGSGVEGDPHIFNTSWTTQVTISSNDRKIDVSWSALGGATAYRVYLGYDFFNVVPGGIASTQYIQTTGTSCSFNRHPKHGVPATASNIATGANLATWTRTRFYVVTAITASGQTSISGIAWGKSHPYRRPIRIEWLAVAGATEYRIYGEDTYEGVKTGKWSRYWTTTNTYFDDDFTNAGFSVDGVIGATGAVPLHYVGTEAASDGSVWYRFLVCGHAVKEITDVFVDGVKVVDGDLGVYALIPGKANYSTYFPNTGNPQYREINGRRYTICYGRGDVADQIARGLKKATANIKGIETAADGTGTLIENYFDQYKHLMKNFVFGEANTTWLVNSPIWPGSDEFEVGGIPTLNDASFTTAQAVSVNRIGSPGYQGAFIIGNNLEQISVRELVKRMNVSGGCFSGFNKRFQFFVTVINEPPPIGETPTYVSFKQGLDIIEGTFEIKDRVSEMENVIVYNALYDHVRLNWLLDKRVVKEQTSIDDVLQERKAQEVDYWCTRDLVQIEDLNGRRFARTSRPPRWVSFETTLFAHTVELGDIIKVTHDEGIGPNGYVDTKMMVSRIDLNPDDFTIRLDCLDLSELIEVGGGFILGDETALPADWLLATAEQRVYGYVGDEVTEQFGDGEPIKRLSSNPVE